MIRFTEPMIMATELQIPKSGKNINFLIKAVEKVDDRLFINMEETEKPADEVLNYYNILDSSKAKGDDEELGIFD